MFGDSWLDVTAGTAIGIVGTILTQGVLLLWYLHSNRIIWPPKPKKPKATNPVAEKASKWAKFVFWRRSWRWRRRG